MSTQLGTGKHVLLTGASGFIAAWVLKELLDQGYTVRATVRSAEKQAAIAKVYSNQVAAGKITFAIVPDIAVPGAHDDAVKPSEGGAGLDFVIHTASPFHMNVTEPKSQMLDPAVQGTRGLLEAFRITSSFASILHPDRLSPPWPGKTYTEEDWNPITWEAASKPGDPASTYRGSKTFAERAAWDFVRDAKPNFDLVTVCPPMVFGPVINDQTVAALNTSNQRVYGYLSGQLKEIAPTGVHLWIDVRDLAVAHVAPLSVPEAGGQRFFTLADEIYTNQDICDILRKNFPEIKDRVPEGKPGSGLGLAPGEYFVGDNSKSKKILGLKYRNLEESIVDTAKTILELEKKGSSA
ncbi:putative dihydroflavonal-4-reductase [Auriculariales sp. MPI-PUGE-AT-0066]|nr:putative dihydroflavonal-4-reductase [Auriculariales sp. MPI-PUGE-AT-0066]